MARASRALGGRLSLRKTTTCVEQTTAILGQEAPTSSAPTYADHPNRSPWIAQLAADGPPQPLDSNATGDVVVVGAGIAGIATAFFVLWGSTSSVMLIERDRVARGATGRNAGQLTTYFERPLSAIADEFGWELAATRSAASRTPTTCST